MKNFFCSVEICNNREGIFFNRAEVVSFGAISFDIGAIRFCFGAIRFCEHTLICHRHVIGKIAGATGWWQFDV